MFIALNSDEWLLRKKGFSFMPWEERAEILEGFGVSVVPVDDSNGTVCEAIERLRPDYFGNGGDRTLKNTPELRICEELGVIPVFNLGGDKIQSSSNLVKEGRDSRMRNALGWRSHR